MKMPSLSVLAPALALLLASCANWPGSSPDEAKLQRCNE